ncbi:MAG: SUMF1/EgtB/PvdO family nonheme iron enzyme [Pseudomonadota bacterium]
MNHKKPNAYKDKPSIFLSSAGVDRELVTRIAAGLRSEGADIWWDQSGIGWGDNWVETLNHELSRCSAYIILIGNSAIHRWVKAELWLAFKHHFEYDLPILPVLLAGVDPQGIPPFLSSIRIEHLPSRPTANDFAALVSVLQHSGPRRRAYAMDLGTGVCPFPGLEPFQHDQESSRYFFGRQVETLEMLRLLGYGLDGVFRRWLQVEGASGVGKSSLVRAGLIPVVKRGWLDETSDAEKTEWITIVMRPGYQPLETLAVELKHALTGRESPLSLTAGTESSPGSAESGDIRVLLLLLKRHLPAQARIILVVDQFEEIFTWTEDDHVRRQFDVLLAEALLDPDLPLFLITAIRSDFMHRFAELPRLEALLNEQAGHYYLRPIKQWGLRDAVLSPARLAGLRWSERTLPGRIVDDAFPAQHGALPLVANVLRLLWEQSRARQDKVLRAEDYLKLGGIGGALANTADQLLHGLGRNGQKRAKRLLLALVRPGGSKYSKRSISLAVALKAAGGGPQARRVLEQLSGVHDPNAPGVFPRLVVVLPQAKAKADETQHTVELVHEILLRTDPRGNPYWKTLKGWVDAYSRQLENREIIQARAKKWVQQGKPWFGGLPSGGELREFKRAGALTSTSYQYLQASSRKNRLIKSVYTVLFLGALLLADRFWLEAQGLGWYDRYTRTLANIGIILEPEMLLMPGGSLMMGSPDALGPDADPDAQGNEFPQHKRIFIKPFLIGKYEVTFAQYDVFARATNRNLPDDQGWGRGKRPIINVSWQDAVAYTKWLSQQTGKENFRLPTEAEWEYAARAGTKTRYWWGDELGKNRANCSGCGSEWDGTQSAPVGSFDPNAFGLYDTAGNVWEWVQDCWHDNYHAAPEDGNLAWMEQDGGFCDPRVVRGGSWFSLPQYARSAARDGSWRLGKIHIRGFRLARDL